MFSPLSKTRTGMDILGMFLIAYDIVMMPVIFAFEYSEPLTMKSRRVGKGRPSAAVS